MGLKRSIAAAVIPMTMTLACSTVSMPVLRHQTGETLGQMRFRASGFAETSRMFAPIAPADTVDVVQSASVFKSSLIGGQAEAGVLPWLDLQAGVAATLNSAGWRVGAKYQAFRLGPWAIAAMVGYGASTGTGSVTYLTSGTPVEVEQTLSVRTWDLSAPVSFRIHPSFALYSGVMLLRSRVAGSFGDSVVQDTSHDYGANFGFKITSGRFEGDLEAAYLHIYDPFLQVGRFIPYFGGSFGITF